METLLDYFKKNEVRAHSLRLLSVKDGIITVAIKPNGLDDLEQVFQLSGVNRIKCELFDNGLCNGDSR